MVNQWISKDLSCDGLIIYKAISPNIPWYFLVLDLATSAVYINLHLTENSIIMVFLKDLISMFNPAFIIVSDDERDKMKNRRQDYG